MLAGTSRAAFLVRDDGGVCCGLQFCATTGVRGKSEYSVAGSLVRVTVYLFYHMEWRFGVVRCGTVR